jgi:glycosyltransferase involved in cell wall biosynthesis/ubiquinone/menaquinone biosynthesis C-methylase UbiE
MNRKVGVSVITIFFNAERFLEEAIDSVFAQTYRDWELLLVDDGSTDRSSEIARCYAERFPDKVRYFEHERHENQGMSASRNVGIAQARGENIAFLDSDDVWLPLKLEEQVSILNAQPAAGVVTGRSQCWHSWTGNPEDRKRDYVQKLDVQANVLVQPPALLMALLQNPSVTTTNSLIRREVMGLVGGFEDSFRGMFEDQVFYAKLSTKVSVFVSNKCWYRWRRHAESACAASISNGQYNAARSTFLEWLQKYLSAQGNDNSQLWNILKSEQWKCRHPDLHSLFRHARYRKLVMEEALKSVVRRLVPLRIRQRLMPRRQDHQYLPAPGEVNFGDLRRLTPLSQVFGFDRGKPVDRYYIENFLADNARDVRGHVLEVGDNSYTLEFGRERVSKSDVLHISASHPHATIVADLAHADNISSGLFDCIILTQTLQLIYEVPAAIRTIYRILKPGGVLLATFPGISQIDSGEWGESWFWSFTVKSAQHLFREVFSEENVCVEAYGNVLSATAFLQGLAAEELNREELDHKDPQYPVTITVRAAKEVT